MKRKKPAARRPRRQAPQHMHAPAVIQFGAMQTPEDADQMFRGLLSQHYPDLAHALSEEVLHANCTPEKCEGELFKFGIEGEEERVKSILLANWQLTKSQAMTVMGDPFAVYHLAMESYYRVLELGAWLASKRLFTLREERQS